MSDYLSVTSLTKYLKMKFDRDPYLERVYLTGQVSNFRRRPSHQYFSLKDEGAVIQATIWAGVFKKLGFELEEGMKINVVGRVQIYEPSGSYSIIIEKAEPDGIGALAIQFEQLRKKLTAEGYFDDRHKQALPNFVKKIGVVTSPSGAVIRDIITTVSRRFPGVESLLFPTKVQGEGAAQEIAENIQKANQRDDLDLLIVGRGGGSIEDLWAFNEEIVVQSIFESRLPVISSVGHETDTTLADFVADRRAATPTAAAELAESEGYYVQEINNDGELPVCLDGRWICSVNEDGSGRFACGIKQGEELLTRFQHLRKEIPEYLFPHDYSFAEGFQAEDLELSM